MQRYHPLLLKSISDLVVHPPRSGHDQHHSTLRDMFSSSSLHSLFATAAMANTNNNHTILNNSTVNNSTTINNNTTTFYSLEPAIVSGINITLSISYILIFVMVMLFVLIFTSLSPVRKQMKSNQFKMIMLVFLLCILQCCALVSRLCYDSLNLNMVLRLDHFVQTHYGNDSEIINQFQAIYSYNNSIVSLEQAGIDFSTYIAMSFFGSLEPLCVLMNSVVMLVVMCFVGNVFLTTVRVSSGLVHSKTIRRVTTLVNIMTLISAVALTLLIFTTFFFIFFSRLNLIGEFYIYFLIVAYVVFVFQILLQLVVSNVSIVLEKDKHGETVYGMILLFSFILINNHNNNNYHWVYSFEFHRPQQQVY